MIVPKFERGIHIPLPQPVREAGSQIASRVSRVTNVHPHVPAVRGAGHLLSSAAHAVQHIGEEKPGSFEDIYRHQAQSRESAEKPWAPKPHEETPEAPIDPEKRIYYSQAELNTPFGAISRHLISHNGMAPIVELADATGISRDEIQVMGGGKYKGFFELGGDANDVIIAPPLVPPQIRAQMQQSAA